MGSSILHVIALVVLVSSGTTARKCYHCVHATRYDLSELPDIDPAIVTAACTTGSNFPAEFEHECNDGDPILDVIRQTINAASPEIGKSVNSILDQLSAKLANKPTQAEYVCATLDVAMKLNLTQPMDIGVVTGRTCALKVAGLDGSVCERQTGQQIVNLMKEEWPIEDVNKFVAELTAVWTNFLESSIGACACETDLCVKKAPAAGSSGTGVIGVFTPLTIISALLSIDTL